MRKILVADDEKNMRWALEKALSKEGFKVDTVSNGREVLEYLENMPDLIIMDLKMPEMDGMETLQRLKEIDSIIPVIMITAHGSIDSAIEAMRLGAIDYLTKPFEMAEVKVIIQRALKIDSMNQEIVYLREELYGQSEEKRIIGESQRILEILETIKTIADSQATILILGESGTGKELAAHAVHNQSRRLDNPFVKINCGALPENLLESELFGHEKGAFTGAIARKPGKFERANGGSIFLDEIGEISPAMQVKLLRIIQEREFERVGGTQTLKADVRIIAATNRNLQELVAKGEFREDLFYRLNVIPLTMPPLRERREDIPLLVDYFLKKYSKESHKDIEGVQRDAMEHLISYNWPGNIRELENVIERAVILCKGPTITSNYLPGQITTSSQNGPAISFALPEDGISLEDVEKSFIMQALEYTKGNQTQAAKFLGISRHTLIYRMEKHNMR